MQVCFPLARRSQPDRQDARARELINQLGLKVLPKESGYLGLIGESTQAIPYGNRKSSQSRSQVY